MIELETTTQIEPVAEQGSYAKYEAGPLPAGYGTTLGNALRRVLLSSLEGAAVTSIQIRDVYHEFTTIAGVKEDVTQIVLNVKRLRLRSFAAHPVQLKLIKSGAGTVTAGDILESADVEIVNPDQVLMTLDADDVQVEMDLTVERGVGYLAAERPEGLPIGVIPVDAIFTPVRKVNFHVDNTRVGQMTNYDKLTLEIETDGTLGPEDALAKAADILVRQFSLFANVGAAAVPVAAASGAPQIPASMLEMPIEELDLPMRAYNSLKRNNIVKVGQLLQLSDDELLRMRNFGKKSLDEMKERLRMRGFLLPDSEPADLEELDLPMRAYNSLKRNNIVKVGQLLQLSDDELLRMRNFGKKSLDEMKERLRMRGFLVPETEPGDLDGLDDDGADDDDGGEGDGPFDAEPGEA